MSGYSLDVYDFGELMENPSFLDINSAWGQDSICDFSTWTQDELDAIFSQELPGLEEGISQDAGMTVGESSVQNASPSPAGFFDTRKEMSDLKQMIADLDKRLNAINDIVPQLVQQSEESLSRITHVEDCAMRLKAWGSHFRAAVDKITGGLQSEIREIKATS